MFESAYRALSLSFFWLIFVRCPRSVFNVRWHLNHIHIYITLHQTQLQNDFCAKNQRNHWFAICHRKHCNTSGTAEWLMDDWLCYLPEKFLVIYNESDHARDASRSRNLQQFFQPLRSATSTGDTNEWWWADEKQVRCYDHSDTVQCHLIPIWWLRDGAQQLQQQLPATTQCKS